MLGTIKEILVNIGDFFTSVGEFVVFFVKEIFEFINLVKEAVVSIPQWYNILPSFLVSLVVALVACKFVLRLVGRG